MYFSLYWNNDGKNLNDETYKRGVRNGDIKIDLQDRVFDYNLSLCILEKK
jgi:hypothetical protein